MAIVRFTLIRRIRSARFRELTIVLRFSKRRRDWAFTFTVVCVGRLGNAGLIVITMKNIVVKVASQVIKISSPNAIFFSVWSSIPPAFLVSPPKASALLTFSRKLRTISTFSRDDIRKIARVRWKNKRSRRSPYTWRINSSKGYDFRSLFADEGYTIPALADFLIALTEYHKLFYGKRGNVFCSI